MLLNQIDKLIIYLDNRWSVRQWIENVCNSIFQLNLYRNPLQQELNDIKHQIWSTRLYMGLLSLSLFILTLYSSVSIGTRIIQINNPSLDIVQQLENEQHSLTCPSIVDSPQRNPPGSPRKNAKSPGTPCRESPVSCAFQKSPKTHRGVPNFWELPLKFSEIWIFQRILRVTSWRVPGSTHQLPRESLNPLSTPPGTHDRDSLGIFLGSLDQGLSNSILMIFEVETNLKKRTISLKFSF